MDRNVMDTHVSMEMARPAMLDQITILAVDPGKVSGWATLRLGEFFSDQLDGMELLRWVDEMLTKGLQFTLVCEDFIYTAATAKKTRQTYSTESIGVLRFLADKYNTEFVLQTPVEAKSFSSPVNVDMEVLVAVSNTTLTSSRVLCSCCSLRSRE